MVRHNQRKDGTLMGKPSTKQVLDLQKILFGKVDWDGFDSASLQAVIDRPDQTSLSFTRFLQNGARLQIVGNHIIDCDANPFIPNGWTVHSHTKGGQLAFDPNKIELYLSGEQKNGGVIGGNRLLKMLAKRPTLNANVLDYLLANPNLIPEEWKGKYVFFFGTIYRDSYGFLFVRCLRWGGDRWYSDYHWLGHDWYSSHPVAVLAG